MGEEEEERNFLNGGKWPYWKKAQKVLLDKDGVAIDEGATAAGEASPDKVLHEAGRKQEKNAKWMGRGKTAALHGGLMKGAAAAAYVPGMASHSKGPLKTLEQIECEEEQRKQDAVLPTSASFSPNGTLVVGYRNGGIFVYRPYKFYRCGNFEYLPLTATDRIISFLNYDEVGTMRNCCRFMHNHTKRLRGTWRINPMREDKYDTVMFHFMRWAVNPNDDRPYYGTTPSMPKLQKVRKAGAKEGESIEEEEEEERHKALARKTPYDDIHFTDTSHCYPYADTEGNIICERYLQRICENPFCRQKHSSLQTLGYSQYYPGAQEAGLELKHLLLACYNVFDPRFVWQKERYIEKLFEFYSVPVRKLVRHEKGMGGATSAAGKDDDDQEEEEEEDKMERDCGSGVKQDEDDEGEAKGKPEKIDYMQFSKRRLPQASDRQTRRVNMGQNVSLLSLEFFLEIMHFLEEDYSGARNIDQHGLFLRTKKVRGGAPYTQTKRAMAVDSEAKTTFSEEAESKARRRRQKERGGYVDVDDAESKASSRSTVMTGATGDDASLASHLNSIREEGEAKATREEDEDDASTIDSDDNSRSDREEKEEKEDAKGEEQDGLTPYGPYDFKSIEKRIYTDVLSQYDFSQPQNRINIPYKPLRPGNKKFLMMPGMQGKTQGVGYSDTQKYLHAYDGQVDRVSGLLGELFK